MTTRITLDVERLRAYKIPDARDRYDAREAIMYALGVGAGLRAELDETHLVYEPQLAVLPTMALVLGTAGFWPLDRNSGLDWAQILHGEQSLRLHRPLEHMGDIMGVTRIGALSDKGLGKPALLSCTRELTDGVTGVPVATLEEVWVLRGGGGFGGENVAISNPLPPMPDRAADAALDLPTATNQAMLYRLMGDRNPLHIDHAIARSAGFDRPILHGLSTMGLVCRALVHLVCGGDPRRVSAMQLRFTAPVMPGETVRTEVWSDGGAIRFRATVPERDVKVIDGGLAELDGFAT